MTAEIISLPCHVDPEGARRLAATLAAVIEDGGDPGPRGAQIRSLGQSLEGLVQTLRTELEKLGLSNDLEALTGKLERLALLARSYPVGEPG